MKRFSMLGAAVLAAPLAATLAATLAASGAAWAQPAMPVPADPNPAHVHAGNFTIEPSHTRVLFSVSHMGFTTWYGEFTGASGSLSLDPKHLAGTSFEIEIPAETISTSNATLDGELKSPAWFDTAKYPMIVFKSEKLQRTGRDTALVTGELTFHGVTRPETLKVTFNGAGINPLSKQYTVGFDATGALKRSDFDQKTYVPLIGDDVSLMISAAFVQK